MNLPVASIDSATPYYERRLGFVVESRNEDTRSVVLVRDDIHIALVENGGDPTQDGCAFKVLDVETLHKEFVSNGLAPALGDPPDRTNGSISAELAIETHDDGDWRVFFVVAPDGLCHWFGEKIS